MRLPSDRDASGRDLGEAELELLAEVLASGHLNSSGGTMTPRLEAAFAGRLGFGAEQAVACASGSAAVHAAIAAVGLQAGDEVVTTPITDMGALTPILYEGGVPAFCDVDPDTGNATAATVAARLGPRTRAVVVTHLFGRPVSLAPVRALCDAHGLVLIEDCAQAFEAEDAGGPVGRVGDLACWSFQQGKHMTCGEGGIVVGRDAARVDRVRRFVNKAWGYGDARPDHDFPALNYRMTELQAAVALAQLGKLAAAVARRRDAAAGLGAALAGTPGLLLPGDPPCGRHSWWRYTLLVDAAEVPGGTDALGAALHAAGIACAPRYVRRPAFACRVFRERAAHPVSAAPYAARAARGGGPLPEDAADGGQRAFAGVWRALERMLVLPINEAYGEAEVGHVAAAIGDAVAALRRGVSVG